MTTGQVYQLTHGVSLVPMTVLKPSAPGRKRGRAAIPDRVLLPIKMTSDLRRRFRMVTAAEDTTYAGMIEVWVNDYHARIERQRRAQAHPLHQPSTDAKSDYPGGGVRR